MKVPNTDENKNKCICPTCPTYKGNDCPKNKNETLYCSAGVGKSACLLVDRGCICGDCPIWTIYGLSKGYFCMNGPAAE